MSAPHPPGPERVGVSLRQKRNRRQAVQDPAELRNGSPGPQQYQQQQKPQLPLPQPSQGSGVSQISQGRRSNDSARSGEPRARPRPKADDSTSNLVKKRYSVRYGQQAPGSSQGAGAPPVPSVPRLPPNFAQQNSSSASVGSQGRNQALDMRALRDPNLQPDQCS